MAAIFQLFSAQDLLRLAPGQFDELRRLISAELAPSAEVRAVLKDRANQVFRQLASPRIPATDPLPLPPPPVSQLLREHLFTPVDLARLDADPAQLAAKHQMLELAIRCERDNSPYVLEVIMKRVYPWFTQQVPLPLPTSDTGYSPFSKAYKVIRALDPPDNLNLIDRGWPW